MRYYSDCYTVKKHNQQGPTGKGGWLYLMVAFIIAVSVAQFYLVRNQYPLFLSWFSVSNSMPFKIGFMIRLIADVVILFLAALTLYFYYKRSSLFPDCYNLWVITLLLSNLLMDVCFLYDYEIMPAIGYSPFLASEGTLILIAITVPYFLTSRRVRNTFTPKMLIPQYS